MPLPPENFISPIRPEKNNGDGSGDVGGYGGDLGKDMSAEGGGHNTTTTTNNNNNNNPNPNPTLPTAELTAALEAALLSDRPQSRIKPHIALDPAALLPAVPRGNLSDLSPMRAVLSSYSAPSDAIPVPPILWPMGQANREKEITSQQQQQQQQSREGMGSSGIAVDFVGRGAIPRPISTTSTPATTTDKITSVPVSLRQPSPGRSPPFDTAAAIAAAAAALSPPSPPIPSPTSTAPTQSSQSPSALMFPTLSGPKAAASLTSTTSSPSYSNNNNNNQSTYTADNSPSIHSATSLIGPTPTATPSRLPTSTDPFNLSFSTPLGGVPRDVTSPFSPSPSSVQSGASVSLQAFKSV